MNAKEIAQKAISQFNKKITDKLFLTIQGDRTLMLEYLKLIEAKGIDSANKAIGKAIKAAYKLTNADERENNPSSTLIQSHQVFK